MQLRLKAALAALSIALTAGLATAAPAAAVTGGQPDGSAPPQRRAHPLLQPGWPVPLLRHPDHTHGARDGRALYGRHRRQDPGDFRSVVALAPPTGFPVAANPATGYTGRDRVAGFLSGTAHAHPDYSNFTDLDNWNDVGVVVLDHPVTNITPATLSPRNYLDAYAQPVLNKTLFTSVGYGTEVRKPDAGPQKPTAELPADPSVRRAAGPEAHRPDPAAERQHQRHPRDRRHLLRRLRWPRLPREAMSWR